MVAIPALIVANQDRWDRAQYKPNFVSEARGVAKRLCDPKAKAVYQEIEKRTGVPWWVVAVIHEREASQSWRANIAQGDPWNQVSRHVPRGRGPFPSFIEAAVDALVNCAPYAARWHDWSPGGALTLLELYNGTGYDARGIASPYLWSGAGNIYARGKYIADGQFSASAVDTQLGCAVMLKCMMEIDSSISFSSGPLGLMQDIPSTDAPKSVKADVEPIPDAGPADEPLPPAPPMYAPQPQPQAYDQPPPAYDGGFSNPVSTAKSIFRSKISGLAIGGGTVGTGTVVASSPTLVDKLISLLSTPQFWAVIAILAVVGAILFCYWRDHGKGSVRQ